VLQLRQLFKQSPGVAHEGAESLRYRSPEEEEIIKQVVQTYEEIETLKNEGKDVSEPMQKLETLLERYTEVRKRNRISENESDPG
jgi:hypothetical protein